MSSDDAIRDYIRTHGGAYTTEAVRQHLIAEGNDPDRIDAIWAQEWGGVQSHRSDSAPRAPFRPASRDAITMYVLICFVFFVILLFATIMQRMPVTSGAGQLEDTAWLLGYILLGGIVGFFITRFRVGGAWWLLAIPLVPTLYAVMWYGICVAAYRTAG